MHEITTCTNFTNITIIIIIGKVGKVNNNGNIGYCTLNCLAGPLIIAPIPYDHLHHYDVILGVKNLRAPHPPNNPLSPLYKLLLFSPRLMCSDPFPRASTSSSVLSPPDDTLGGISLDKNSPSCDFPLADSKAECSRDWTNPSRLFSLATTAVAEGGWGGGWEEGGGTPAVGVVEKRLMAELFFLSSWKAALKLRAAAADLRLPVLELWWGRSLSPNLFLLNDEEDNLCNYKD